MRKIASGKVRDIYQSGDNLVVVTTDRVSAFDVVLNEEIPYKGLVLNQLSRFWFEKLSDIIPNHMITTDVEQMPEEFQEVKFQGRCMLVRTLNMIPIECVVRGYLTGSAWESYKKDNTVCGIKFLPGLRESEKFSSPIFTPTTKATESHDENLTYKELSDLIGTDMASKLKEVSLALYEKGSEYARSKGIIVADTKFEFGIDENGNLVLADEVLTPDSSRFWPADKYRLGEAPPSLDKQFLRDWLKSNGWNDHLPAPIIPKGVIYATVNKYFEIYKILTGEQL